MRCGVATDQYLPLICDGQRVMRASGLFCSQGEGVHNSPLCVSFESCVTNRIFAILLFRKIKLTMAATRFYAVARCRSLRRFVAYE